MSLNNYFDKIYCIHVSDAIDRLECIKDIESKLNCTIDIFDAATPQTIDIPDRLDKLKPTEYACAYSHIKLWDKIIKDNPSRPLILEDDIVINGDKCLNKLEQIKDKLTDELDVLFLGLNYTVARLKKTPKCDLLYRVNFAFALHSYSPSISFLKSIKNKINLYNVNKKLKPIDVLTADELKNYRCLTFKPSLLYQKASKSLIHGVFVDQEKHLR